MAGNEERIRSASAVSVFNEVRRTASAGEGLAWAMALLHQEGVLQSADAAAVAKANSLLSVAHRTALLCDSAFAEGLQDALTTVAGLLEQDASA